MIGTNAKSAVNVRIDADVKETAVKLLYQMGIDRTTAIEMFYRKIIAENRLPFQPEPLSSLDEQIVATFKKKNLPVVDFDVDENGNILVDKDKHPLHYDWAVNG